MTDALLFETRDRVSRVIINRPGARNALTPQMIQDLAAHLRHANADEAIGAVLIGSTGNHFSGGGDVSGFGETVHLPGEERSQMYERRLVAAGPLYVELATLEKPLVCAMRGAVAGAAISLALAADFAIAAESSFFVFAHAALGLCLDGGLSYFLPRILGERKARTLAMMGARLDSSEALALGLVTARVPDAELEIYCAKLVERLAAGPTRAFAYNKRLLSTSMGNSISDQLRAEARAVAQCAGGHDFVEGVTAFLEKRHPTFTGH